MSYGSKRAGLTVEATNSGSQPDTRIRTEGGDGRGVGRARSPGLANCLVASRRAIGCLWRHSLGGELHNNALGAVQRPKPRHRRLSSRLIDILKQRRRRLVELVQLAGHD